MGNVIYEVIKFDLTFIYNYYGLLMFIRIRNYMKGFYQLFCRKQESQDKIALDLILREFKEETDLIVISKRVKQVRIDKFYNCIIYAIKLEDSEVF